MPDDPPRNRTARLAAEQALIRVVDHYGAIPEFVILGGLVPELLCADSGFQHAGTTDVDVQADLEIACGAINARHLEQALHDAGFEPDNERVWRWTTDGPSPRTVVKFELLADLDHAPAETTVNFDECDQLGAANLRGTGFAARDIEVMELHSQVDGDERMVQVNVTGLAGFLLAKCAAARSRRKPKDWYDIAFVLLHNDTGGPDEAAQAVLQRFGSELDTMRTDLDDLLANFDNPNAQGPRAYAEQMLIDHPDLDSTTLAADAVIAIEAFHRGLFPR